MATNSDSAMISEVLVFKTNISSDLEVEKVREIFSGKKNITRWNIDRDDIDNVLRIECDNFYSDAVIRMLCDAGFECEELPD